ADDGYGDCGHAPPDFKKQQRNFGVYKKRHERQKGNRLHSLRPLCQSLPAFLNAHAHSPLRRGERREKAGTRRRECLYGMRLVRIFLPGGQTACPIYAARKSRASRGGAEEMSDTTILKKL